MILSMTAARVRTRSADSLKGLAANGPEWPLTRELSRLWRSSESEPTRECVVEPGSLSSSRDRAATGGGANAITAINFENAKSDSGFPVPRHYPALSQDIAAAKRYARVRGGNPVVTGR